MQRRLFLSLSAGGLAAAFAAAARAQTLGDLLGARTAAPSSAPSAAPAALGLPSGLTSAQAEGGLKEALISGAVAAVLKVGRVDGYWGDGKIRIPLPGVLGQTQRTLGQIGLSAPLDDLQRKVNVAAEKAAPQARDMFVGAIRSMTVEDVVGVLRGGDTAGTTFLKSKTAPQLTGLFRPPMARALSSTGALRSLDKVVAKQGLGSALGKSPSASLTDFAVAKALDGLFYYVGEEERAIRRDPLKRTTDVLKSVFGRL